MELDPSKPLRRRDAIASGFTDREIRRLYSACGERRLRRGVSVAADVFEDLDAPARHRLLIASAAEAISPDAILSHQSAAVLYAARDFGLPLSAVHFTRNRSNGGRTGRGLAVHCAPVDSVAMVDGYLVTTPARTIVDLSRTLPFATALVAADSIARTFGTTDDELREELSKAKGRAGIASAHRVVAMIDPRSESAGETRSRIMFRRLGLPEFLSQGNVIGPDGKFIGRVDFYTEDGFVGEFDGEIKFGRSLRPGDDPGNVAFEEKYREDLLRDCGSSVARWIWRELDGTDAEGRIRRALDRRGGFEGRITPARQPSPRRLEYRDPRDA